MKTFRKWGDFKSEDLHPVYDDAANQWAIDIGFDFAHTVLQHTGCRTVDDLVAKYPEIDDVAMRMWLAQEPVEDDMSRMFSICYYIDLDMKLDIVDCPEITRYSDLVRGMKNDQDTLLRRPKD